MKHLFAAFALVLALTGCTSLKVTEVDPKTGYFPTTSKATVVLSKPMNLDARKSLLLANGAFERGQLANMRYFDEIMSLDDLQKRVIQADVGDKVPTVQDRIGLNNAAKHYKPFMWFRFERVGAGRDMQGRFVLTDPVTMEDYFIAETHLDYVWAGVNDQNNWYPMFNAFIDYVRQNSATYKR